MTKQTFSFDNPHKDIGKQKFRVKKYYNVWVEYDVVADTKDEAENAVIDHGGIQSIDWEEGYHKDEPVEVYASDWNYNDMGDTKKVAECIPYEDSDSIDYADPDWSTNDFEWQKEEA
tara:strand:+ start:524 stop:874 length:351 start_codon:yes stop_codon:yes gene_type:complete